MRHLLWSIPAIFALLGFWSSRGGEGFSFSASRLMSPEERAAYRIRVFRHWGAKALYALSINSFLFILIRLYIRPSLATFGLLATLFLLVTSLALGAYYYLRRGR